MYMSKISPLFQQTKSPNNMLSQISNKMIAKQQGIEDMESATTTQKLKMDSYTKSKLPDSLEEMDSEVLEFHLELSKLYARFSSKQEADLSKFKERLQGMDQTIQGYQDMVDGKTTLPEDVKLEDVVTSLAEATETRQQFLTEGVDFLNKWSGYWVKSDTFDRHMTNILGENKFADTDVSNWKIDTSSTDIYAQIDQVLEVTHDVTEVLNQSVNKIHNILKERGFGDDYNSYWEASRTNWTSVFDETQSMTIQQMMLDNLKSSPSKEVE